jgi:hypothetical protein
MATSETHMAHRYGSEGFTTLCRTPLRSANWAYLAEKVNCEACRIHLRRRFREKGRIAA